MNIWLTLAFTSALMLGFYDVFKKRSLSGNAVMPVLLINTLLSSLIFAPFIILSAIGVVSSESSLYCPDWVWSEQIYIVIKAFIVLSSWLFGYFAMKHLPITIVGPVNATRPVMVLVGAMLLFGERLNIYQWVGVLLAILSLALLSRAGKREGIDFRNNKWIFCLVAAAILGAVSGLYDKYLMARLNPISVQSWFNIYQLIIMSVLTLLLWYPRRKQSTPFQWRWSIVFIPIFLCIADFAYFSALSDSDSMISVVSMIRRGSVVVSFTCGAIVFKEKNLRSKALDLAFILIGMLFLYFGSR